MANIEDLPEDILLDVLSQLPMKDLIHNCRLVCSRWRDVVDLPALWKRKYQQKGGDLKKSKIFYIFSHLEKNLIKNPCGEEGLDFWDIKTSPEGQWKIKEVSGAESSKLQKWDFFQRNYYVEVEDIPYQQVKRCFAAYNGLCVKSQLITLKNEGYWDELMDEGRPTIAVKDWFYRDLSISYQLCVKLLSADFKVIREYCSKDLYKCDSDGDGWREVSYTFHNFPPGVRHIHFQHQGEKLNWLQSRCGMSIAKCIRITKRMRAKSMRITKSSVTIGPFSLDKAMYGREGRDLSSCVMCPCRGNYIHWFYSNRSISYQLCVKLLSADFEVIQEYCSKDLYKRDSDDGGWREVSYTFHNFPPGVRHIHFQHQGEKLNWPQSRCGMSIAKCIRITKRMRAKSMRITKSSITVGKLKTSIFFGQSNAW